MAVFVVVHVCGCGSKGPETASVAPQSVPVAGVPAPAGPSDPGAAAALQDIAGRQGSVQAYTGTILVTGRMDLPLAVREFETRTSVKFKRPHLYAVVESRVKHPSPKLEGLVTTTVVDGQMWWELRQPAAGSGRRVLESMGRTPSDADAAFIARQETVSVRQRNLPVLQRAGLTDDVLAGELQSLMAPFALCDLATLKVESEDANQWVFTARRKTGIEDMPELLRLTVSKADGMLRALRADSADGKADLSLVAEEVQVNPELGDDVFRFAPPQGVEPMEITEMEAERLRNRTL